MILQNLQGKNLLLGSGSPRRKMLLEGLKIPFKIVLKDIDEDYDPTLQREEVARFLSELKASAYTRDLGENDILITSDTTVCLDGEILNKPKDRNEAISMLEKLSGKTHVVITAFSLSDAHRTETFHDETKVTFKPLSTEEIEFYVDEFSPLDKAGAYGAQEFMGYIAIEKLEGSYFNVMGLPIHMVYDRLKNW